MNASLDKFRSYSTVLLGGVVGACVAFPLSLSMEPSVGKPLAIAFTVLGVAAGYKNRFSAGFFYFSLICATILLTMVWYSIQE